MFSSPYFKALEDQARPRDHRLGLAAPPRGRATTWTRTCTPPARRACACCSASATPAARSARSAAACPRVQGVHQGVPQVQAALPVGEGLADLERGQPLRRADLPQGRAASRASTTTSAHNCYGCNVVGARRAGHADDESVGPGVPPHGPQGQADLGPAQLHRREPLPHERARASCCKARARAARSGSRRPAGWSCAATTRGSRSPATSSTRRGRPGRCSSWPRLSPRVRRIYFYHWQPTPGPAADMGLRAGRPARQAAPRLRRAAGAASAVRAQGRAGRARAERGPRRPRGLSPPCGDGSPRSPRLAAALALAGCGSLDERHAAAARSSATTLTVYSLLPQPGAGQRARTWSTAEKLAAVRGRRHGRGVRGQLHLDRRGQPAATTAAATAAVQLRDALADPQITALIGPLRARTPRWPRSRCSTRRACSRSRPAPATPASPSRAPGRAASAGSRPAADTLARLAGDDIARPARCWPPRAARPASAAARGDRAGARARWPTRSSPRCSDAGARTVADPARADAVIYAGDDAENAAGVADALGARGAGRGGRAARRADLRGDRGAAEPRPPAAAPCWSRARPSPARRRALREFERRFRERYDRAPGPYAAVGYEAMRGVLAAIATRRRARGLPAGGDRRVLRGTARTDALTGDVPSCGPAGAAALAPFTASAAPARESVTPARRRASRRAVISSTRPSARETRQASLACLGRRWKSPSSRPGHPAAW